MRSCVSASVDCGSIWRAQRGHETGKPCAALAQDVQQQKLAPQSPVSPAQGNARHTQMPVRKTPFDTRWFMFTHAQCRSDGTSSVSHAISHDAADCSAAYGEASPQALERANILSLHTV
jgi:hypothetical protein